MRAIGLDWVCEWQMGKARDEAIRIEHSTASDSIFRVWILFFAGFEWFSIFLS